MSEYYVTATRFFPPIWKDLNQQPWNSCSRSDDRWVTSTWWSKPISIDRRCKIVCQLIDSVQQSPSSLRKLSSQVIAIYYEKSSAFISQAVISIVKVDKTCVSSGITKTPKNRFQLFNSFQVSIQDKKRRWKHKLLGVGDRKSTNIQLVCARTQQIYRKLERDRMYVRMYIVQVRLIWFRFSHLRDLLVER